MNTISVIITTYNDSEYLVRSIRSVINQEYKVDELIIIDDGSDDDTAAIIVERFFENSKGIKVIYHYQNNSGPSSARNKGVNISTSKYITFLDADDKYYKDNLVYKFDLLKKNKSSSDFVAVYGSYKNSYSGEIQAVMEVIGKPKSRQIDTVGATKGISGSLPSYIIQRDKFLEVGGLDENLRANEDFDFILRLLKLDVAVIGCNEPGFYRDYRPNSLSRNGNFMLSLKRQLQFLNKARKLKLMSNIEILKRTFFALLRAIKLFFLSF